jgi:hypothetical protein
MQIILFPLYAVMLLTSVVFLKLGGALPFRTILLITVFSGLIVFHQRQFQYFLRQHANVVILFAFMAALGIGQAIAWKNGIGDTSREALRQILQPFMLLVATYMMCLIVGVKRTVMVLLAVTALAGIFAVFQYLGIGFAWQIREIIGDIQYETIQNREFIRGRSRPMGLGYTPIELSYLLVSCYISILILYYTKAISPRFFFASLILILACTVANQTRSALLGILVSEVFRFLSQGGLRRYLVVILAAVAANIAMNIIEMGDNRFTSFQDQSAMGRQVLYLFGVRLFVDNPLGLGWGFHPSDYAWLYWEHLTEFGKPQIVFRLELHNAFLNYLLVYGLMGLAPVVFLALARPKTALLFALVFVSYFVHCLLHNKGFFYTGLMVWIPVAIFLYERDRGRLNLTLPWHRRTTPTVQGRHTPVRRPVDALPAPGE